MLALISANGNVLAACLGIFALGPLPKDKFARGHYVEAYWAKRVVEGQLAAKIVVLEAKLAAEEAARKKQTGKGRSGTSPPPPNDAALKAFRAALSSQRSKPLAWKLLSVNNLEPGKVGLYPSPVKVVQVPSPGVILARSADRLWLIEGMSTRNVADGDGVALPGPVEYQGTKSYTAADGTKRTVRALKLLDLRP